MQGGGLMIAEKSRFIVAAYSKGLYYAIGFASFALVIYFMDLIKTKVEIYVSNNWAILGGTYLVAYILAIFVVPMLGFWIASQMIDRG